MPKLHHLHCLQKQSDPFLEWFTLLPETGTIRAARYSRSLTIHFSPRRRLYNKPLSRLKIINPNVSSAKQSRIQSTFYRWSAESRSLLSQSLLIAPFLSLLFPSSVPPLLAAWVGVQLLKRTQPPILHASGVENRTETGVVDSVVPLILWLWTIRRTRVLCLSRAIYLVPISLANFLSVVFLDRNRKIKQKELTLPFKHLNSYQESSFRVTSLCKVNLYIPCAVCKCKSLELKIASKQSSLTCKIASFLSLAGR